MTLAELIAGRRNELGLSYERIAARAREHGLRVTEDALRALVTEQAKAMPRPMTIKAIAVGLDVPVIDVLMAAGRSVDLVPADDSDPDRVLAWSEITEDLDPAELDQALAVVRSFVRAIRPQVPSVAEPSSRGNTPGHGGGVAAESAGSSADRLGGLADPVGSLDSVDAER